MNIHSAKAKGRSLQKKVKQLILETWTTLEDDDVRSTSMGCSGEDILFSPAARKLFPFSVECKNQENINLQKSIDQSEYNSRVGIIPILIIKKNHKPIYAIFKSSLLIPRLKIDLQEFIQLHKTTFAPKINIWKEIDEFEKSEFIFHFPYKDSIYSCMKFDKLLELVKNYLSINT